MEMIFTALAEPSQLQWLRAELHKQYELKHRGILGPCNNTNEVNETTVLNRVVRWTSAGIEYEADPKHRDLILEHFDLGDESRGLTFNGDKEDKLLSEFGEEKLVGKEATEFRALAARGNFLSLDCPDLQFGVKQVGRDMAVPSLPGTL